jgi:hypothetical protein
MSADHMHIMRPRDDKKSPSGDSALCGARSGPYAVVGRGERIPESEAFPVCPDCEAAHLAESA